MKLSYEMLQRMRIMNDISQTKLAKEIGCTRNYISMIENGKQTYTEEQCNKILNALYKLIQEK